MAKSQKESGQGNKTHYQHLYLTGVIPTFATSDCSFTYFCRCLLLLYRLVIH